MCVYDMNNNNNLYYAPKAFNSLEDTMSMEIYEKLISNNGLYTFYLDLNREMKITVIFAILGLFSF